MKNFIKILTALAAVIGAVYAIATYGEEIVAWARSILAEAPAAEEAPAEVPASEPVAEDNDFAE